MDYSKISPWNSGDFPVKVNNIRFNQNNTLITIATSRGYKIFSSKTLRKVQEETELVRDLGDLKIVMTYYESSIVFFTGKKNNKIITQRQFIIFDDYGQKQMGKFESKEENIINFYVSKNAIFIALENNLVILELFSLKIINKIENVEINDKLVSFNVNNSIAYLLQNQKKNIYINKYDFKHNLLSGKESKCINCTFEWVQSLKLSQSGNYIAIVSILGNKIHIYLTSNCSLIKCIFIGKTVFNIQNISFIYNKEKENYFSVNLNSKAIKIYRLDEIQNNYCICDNHLDDDILNGKVKNERNNNILNYIWPTKNGDITDYHLNITSHNNIIFSEFFINSLGKSLVIIDDKGFYYIYFFNKEKTKNPIYYAECKWI